MSERLDNLMSKTGTPELVAGAAGYVAGSFGFDYLISPSVVQEIFHNFESSASGVGVAVAAFGLTKIIRVLRNQARTEVN